MKEESHNPSNLLKKQDWFKDPTLPLQVNLFDPHPVSPMHGHDFEELVIILNGSATHVIDDQRFPVKGGDVFVIPQNRQHKYQDMHNLALADVLFDAKMLKMEQWDIRTLPGFHALFSLEPAFRLQHQFRSRLQLSVRRLACVKELLDNLALETEQRNPGYPVMATGLFMQLVVLLARFYSTEPTEESIDLLRIGDAIAHIETQYSSEITLDQLAAKSHLSKRHFTRIFSECMGRSPIDHLMRVRVQKAADLLRHTELSITQIAYECGFADSNYLARYFRKVMNQTPSQYRNNEKPLITGKRGSQNCNSKV